MFSRRIGMSLILFSAIALLAPRARADFEVVNHSNDLLSVAVTHTGPNGRVETTGWTQIKPGEARVVYVGPEREIGVSILFGPAHTPKIPHDSFGTTVRLVHGQSGFRSEIVGGAGVTLLYWADNFHSLAPGMPPPPGWYPERFYIVKGNDRAEILP